MVQGWVLVDHSEMDNEHLRSVSLRNAKQLLIGGVPGQVIVHVAANTPADLTGAVLEIGRVPGVTNVTLVAMRHT